MRIGSFDNIDVKLVGVFLERSQPEPHMDLIEVGVGAMHE